ncbi:MAG: MerR family transcriptional regulator [Candidatus Xenobiia bacterium LiM19]
MSDELEPYFVISVVSKMLKVHPQTIRHYEKLGLLEPHRTDGNMRLYSKRDVERLEQICSYTNLGVNLAGVEIIVKLLEKMEDMKMSMHEQADILKREMEEMRKTLNPPPHDEL